MYPGETSTSSSKKHHRIHPINDSNSTTNDHQKAHIILNLSSNDEDTSLPTRPINQRTNSQTSNSSSSIDIRATDVIKRITSPSGTMSNTDEILPQTFLRRMSVNFHMNSLVPAGSSTTVLPSIHDVNSTVNTDDNCTHSVITTITNLYNNTNECEICYSSNECENLQMCKHHFCSTCLRTYLVDKIRNGCPALLECPHSDCKQIMHPDDIKRLLNESQTYERYETFMLRRVLQKMPDTRWCPYPNCDFAVLVENARKASKFDCPVCKKPFCQRCSQVWHPNLTCELASAQRAAQDPTLEMLMKSSSTGGHIRACPRCKSPIEKLNDGSCNHIRCAICTCEFCWLCMKEVDNLHFITPTGCTFYGQKRWSKRKSILFLILSWIITPILAILLIVLAIPILLILLPIMMTRKFYQHSVDIHIGSCRRFILCTFVFISIFILTPLILLLALIVGIPLLIFFIYFYMPKRYITANF
ncbi:hypothetical protein I4U23_007470 [Adineta vaga]|nr:hypothetical protein I4U23_007470 [Adineta vaga]